MNFCPECGTRLEPKARFCHECGTDTSKFESAKSAQAEETQATQVVEQQPVLIEVKRILCPQCGSGISAGERFCLQCGFDILTKDSIKADFIPVQEPEKLFFNKVPEDQPVAESINTEPAPQPESLMEPVTAPVNQVTESFISSSHTKSVTTVKTKKSVLSIVLIVLVAGVLGAVAFYSYDSFQKGHSENTSDTISNMELPPMADLVDTSSSKTVEKEQPVAEQPSVKPTPSAKPMNKIDQELAKQKVKQQTKPAQTSQTKEQQTKPEENKKASPVNENDKNSKVFLEVGRKEDAKNKNPKNPSRLVISKPTMIVRITTDHYNGGMGTSGGGSISLKDHDGKVIATFKAYGKDATDGTPYAKWVCEPHKVLISGTYYIWDSDFSTWSKTFLGSGFIVVEGYEVE